jgi:SAM-dependent methyltransferase
MTLLSGSVDEQCRHAVLTTRDGSVIPLFVDRWSAAPGPEELTVLDRAVGPVLDVGCGPGRHVHELAARRVVALGVDISGDAVAFARERGSIVLQRSVFGRLPNEGRWRTALLMDGNIGIGGNAVALLRRLRAVLTPHGSVLAELEAPGAATTVDTVRVERAGEAGPWFPWARVSIDGIDDIATAAGLRRTWTHEGAGRWFVQLTR